MLPDINGEFNIVKDPELIFLPSGKPKLKLRCSAKDRVKDDSGKWVDGKPLYIDVQVWQQAEALAESVVKGDTIILTGRLKSDEWTDKDGNMRSNLYIEASNVGPSVRWGVAKTLKASGNNGGIIDSVNAAMDALGATVVKNDPSLWETPQPDAAPF